MLPKHRVPTWVALAPLNWEVFVHGYACLRLFVRCAHRHTMVASTKDTQRGVRDTIEVPLVVPLDVDASHRAKSMQ